MASIWKTWWFKTLIIGVLLRLVLMPITIHPDLWGHSFVTYFFAYKGELNIYDFLLNLPKDYPLVKNVGVTDIFIYPPLTYFTLGIFRLLVKPFADPNFIPWLMNNLSNVYNYKLLGLQIFLFKLPYLFVDIGAAFLLAGLFDDAKKKKMAFKFWIFNPVTIYTTFMVGQLDILPVFFTILSCFLIKKDKLGWGLFALGVGAGYKMYPLMFVPVAAFLLGKNLWGKIKLLLVGILPFILSIAPYLGSVGFRQMVLFAPKSGKMLFMNWPMTAAEGLLPFIIFLSIIYFLAYYSEERKNVEVYFTAILLLIYSVTHYHPQWFLWVTPFLIYWIVKLDKKYWELVLIFSLSWLFITLMFESSLSYGLFSPIWPALKDAPSLSLILGRYTDVFVLKSIIRSVFAGASIFYCYKLFVNSKRPDHA